MTEHGLVLRVRGEEGVMAGCGLLIAAAGVFGAALGWGVVVLLFGLPFALLLLLQYATTNEIELVVDELRVVRRLAGIRLRTRRLRWATLRPVQVETGSGVLRRLVLTDGRTTCRVLADGHESADVDKLLTVLQQLRERAATREDVPVPAAPAELRGLVERTRE
ncbi:MAG: hypothetical protein H6738_23110 [Alphaproteobacteria bacterium]|nr:hypothetical protein [Alphaproteobacteria bacterium]MCB9699694.1 hypothetical protein [Alphaproteobacteria bacterium]